MLAAPGGGGGTAWDLMSLDEMHRLIQNPDTEKHWSLVDGWRKSAELVNSHLFQVQSYRDNLAAVWPPKKSPAAEAYLRRLDAMLANLKETYEAALANHDALAAATLSLSLAQRDVQKIYDEYQANAQLLTSFEAKHSSPTPRPIPHPSGEQPPVAPGRQEELRQRAAVLLSGVSAELAQAQMRLVRPTPYGGVVDDEQKKPNDGHTHTAPLLPPIAASSTSGGAAGEGSDRTPATSPRSVTPSQATVTTPGVAQQHPGLVLGGANTPSINAAPVGPPAPPALPGEAISPNTVPGLLPHTTQRPPLGNPLLPAPPGRGVGIPSDGIIRPGSPNSAGNQAIPPGGLIGAVPSTGQGQPATRSSPRRVNPIGGIIGDTNATGNHGRAGQQASTVGSQFGHLPGRRQSSADPQDEPHWDPNNPWETARGVDPVIMPSREPRIDPGPVIGLK